VTGPVPLRLKIQSEWENDIPLKFLWTISFLARGAGAATINAANSLVDIGKNVSTILKRYEGNNKWVVKPNIYSSQSDQSNNYGYMYATAVAFPNDAYNVNNSDLNNSGGFLPGYIGGQRGGYGGSNSLNITFLETNIDIIDYFIRPWIIAASYKGLIEDGKEDIKCNIMVNYYTRDKDQYKTNIIRPGTVFEFERRKSFMFENVVPYQVNGDSISYGDLSIGELTKAVSFAFTNYYTTPVV
jgi:hypothetical protein